LPALQKSLNNRRENIVIHHNHPDDLSLSAQDILVLFKYPGLVQVLAHGHQGSYFSAEKVKINIDFLAGNVLLDALSIRLKKLMRRFSTEFQAGLFNGVQAHMINNALAKHGLINYNFGLRPHVVKIIKQNQIVVDIIEQELGNVIDQWQ
jgi:hypothetical protein